MGTWTRRRQGLGLGGEAWWVGGEGLKAQALVAPKQAWRGNQHHHQPCPPSHHTPHTAEKRGTSHKAQWWCVVGEALTCLSIHLTTTTRRGRGKDRGVGSRDRKKGGGTKTSGCWWWWRDGHWWHHTHELTEKTEALCPSTITNTHTHRQEKDRDKEKDRTRQRTRSGRWVWLCKKRRRKQVEWWVTTSHKSTQGKAKQPSLTPFLSSTPPFSLPFSPFFLSIPSPHSHNGLYLFKLKNTLNSFSLFSLSKTHTQKRKTK